MKAAFSSGVFALVAEDFDSAERAGLAARLRNVLEACHGHGTFMHMYERELALVASLLYYSLSVVGNSDSGVVRTAGQDYCGLSLVSPTTDSLSSNVGYAALPTYDFLLLHSVLSLVDYLRAPAYSSALSRAVLPYLPRMLTAAPGSTVGGLVSSLGEIHRMFLLVDGRFATPLHRLWQIRMTTSVPSLAGQRREPDRKMVVLAWLLAFKLSIQGVPKILNVLRWLRSNIFATVDQSDSKSGGNINESRNHSQLHEFQYPRLTRKCALCMDFIVANQPACAPCGHIYCFSCLTRWASDQPRCPLCRASVRPQDVRMLYHL